MKFIKYDDQKLMEKVQSEVDRLLKKYVKEFTFSDNYKNQVSTIAYKRLREKENITARDITEMIKVIIGKSFMDTMRAKPTSNLYKSFFEPYKNIYERSNELLGVSQNNESLLLFVYITINVLFKDAFGAEQDILVTYQQKLRELKKQMCCETKNTSVANKTKPNQEEPKEKKTEVKKESFLLEKKFKKDKSILYTVLPTLSQRESQVIRNIVKRESRKDYLEYPYAVDKLMKSIRLYFLLKALNYNYTQINETITLANQNNNHFEVLANLQNQFLEGTAYKSDTIDFEIQTLKNRKPSLAKTISIFLGLEEYDYQMTTTEIIEIANDWKEVLMAKKTSFFQEFGNIPKEKIRLIVDCFKNENTLYYELLTKYHGPYLHQTAFVEKEDQELYEQAKNRIFEILQLEKNGKIIIDSHDKIFLDTDRFFTNFKVSLKPNNTLSKILPEIPIDALENIIQSFQNSSTIIYLNVLLQLHGVNFQEENPLTEESQKIYGYAIQRIKKEYQKTINMNENTLFEKLEATTEKEKQKIIEVIQTYKQNYPYYYQILIKKHGENFQKIYPITEEEKTHYLYVLQMLKRDLQRPLNLFLVFPNVNKQTIRDIVNIFKEREPKHYQILIDIHGETLLENRVFTPLNKDAYNKAINCMKNILNNDYKSLYKILEPISKEQVDHLLSILKRNYPDYYQILLERFGNSFLEWNKIPAEKNNLYGHAIAKLKRLQEQLEDVAKKMTDISPEKLQMYLKEYQYNSPKSYEILIKKHGIDFTEYNRLDPRESSQYYMVLERFIEFTKKYPKEVRSLFDRLPLIPKEFIQNAVDEWKTTYPLYYNVVTLKHGESLLEEHRVSTSDGTTYEYILKKLRNDYRNLLLNEYKKISRKKILTKTLRENKQHLMIVKEKRALKSFEEIQLTYQLTNEELCKILANNLLLFENPKAVIEEIITYSENGLSLLLNSSNFLYIFDTIPQVKWNKYLRELVAAHPELKPHRFMFIK